MGAPPCTPVSPTGCSRRSPPLLSPPSRSRLLLPQRGSTPSGSVAPSCLPSPPSSRCGSPSRSTTSAAHPLSTGSASKCFNTFNLLIFLSIHPVIIHNLLEDFFECSPLENKYIPKL